MDDLRPEQAAALLGVSVRRLNQLVHEENGLRHSALGRFDCTEFGVWLARRLRPDGFQDARTRLTIAQADKTELEAKELAGELVRLVDVAQIWGEEKATIRAKLLPFPSKIAQRIAPPERIAEVQAEAQAVVYEVLRELADSDGLPRGARAAGAANGHHIPPAADLNRQSVGGSASVSKPGVKRRARKVVNSDG